VREVADHLENFYHDCMAGKRPRLALMAPPQHGKSFTITDFIAWVAGMQPNWKTIFGSFSEELGTRANNEVKRLMKTDRYLATFSTRIDMAGRRCNDALIEYVDHKGSFRNTTVQGQINGLALNLEVIDDPVKGSEEASSRAQRDKTWNWFANDFMGRLDQNAGVLIIMTRWHVDDLLGRYLDRGLDVTELRYPALAERDEIHLQYDDEDKPHRVRWCQGTPLFPQWKPLAFLEEQRKVKSAAAWQALYQQRPIIVGGGQIPIAKLEVLPLWEPSKIKHSVRYWDKAATAGGDGSFTAGVLMHSTVHGDWWISHVVRGHWSVYERESAIQHWANVDRSTFGSYEVVVEQEPGSGGKESAENTSSSSITRLNKYTTTIKGRSRIDRACWSRGRT
jgi:hypothetical protein